MIRCSNFPGKYLLLSLIFIFSTTACTLWFPRVDRYLMPERKYTYQQPDRSDDGWETATLKNVDIDSEKIDTMMHDILRGKDRKVHSIVMVKNGKLVLEEYFYGYNKDKLHCVASVSKSITSVLTGIAIDQQVMADTGKKAYEYFTKYTGTEWIDQKYPITIHH